MGISEKRLTAEQQNLVEKHLALVDKVITKYIIPNASSPDMDPNDLRQTGCLALCRAALSYDGKRPFEPYAIRAVRNALMDYCRMANRQVNCSLDEPVASSNSTLKDFFEVEADGESAYERLRTSEAFAYLKEQQRQYTGVVQKGISCLIWRAQGYNSKDLSQYFDTSTNSVRAWMSHAAKVLRTEQQLYDLLS